MSAYLLSKKSIDVLVYSAFYRHNNSENTISIWNNNKKIEFSPKSLGQALVNQNYASVNFRYRENHKPYIYEYGYHTDFKTATGVALLRLCHCYDYQSSETDNYYRSNAAKIINYIKSNLIKNLPGYAGAPHALYTDHFA
jgi:hypothetical protein